MNSNVTVDPAEQSVQEVHNQLKNIAKFFCDYASTLLSSGATTMRIQRKVKQMAEAWDIEVIFTIMPANVLFTLWTKTRTLLHLHLSVGARGHQLRHHHTLEPTF